MAPQSPLTKYTTSTSAALRRHQQVSGDSKQDRHLKAIAALEKTSQYLAVETDIHIILSKIATIFGKALGAKYVNFWEFTPDKKSLYITAAYGMKPEYIAHSKKHPIKAGTLWVGRAIKTGKPWATSNIQKDPLLIGEWIDIVKKQNYNALLCMPLKRKNETIGGMCIYYKDVHKFEYTEMSLANIVANQAATALANSKLFNELATEQNKTHAVLQSLQDGLIMYDLDGRILLFNHKAQDYLWLSSQAVLNEKVTAAKAKEDIYWRNLYEISRLKSCELCSQEYVITAPMKRVLSITYVPVRSQKRKIGSMQVLSDITKDKEIELLKSNFVSVASHQLRTPLSRIKWGLEALSDQGDGKLNVGQQDLIKKLHITNESLILLIKDLLDVSRIEQGQFNYKFADAELHPLVSKIVHELKPASVKRQVPINLIPPASALPLIRMDAEKLDMAIRNVIDNAIKYSLPGNQITMKYHLDEKNKFVFLFIEDQGVGIPPEDQKHIFVKFFRARNVIRLQTEGSGLGLNIAKEIALKHKINLEFESHLDKGTTFIFQIPYGTDDKKI